MSNTKRPSGHRRQGQGESVTSVRRLKDRDRTLKALELRKLGLTWDVIAQQAGFRNKQSVHAAVSALLERTAQEPSDQVRKLELERLDMLWSRAMPGVGRGDSGSINTALHVMERRAKLLGLDAPERTEIEIKVDIYNVILKEVVLVFLDVNKAPDELARAADFARRVDQLAKERLLTPGLPMLALPAP